MISDSRCQELIKKYLQFLSGSFETGLLGRGCSILTPFVRPDGETVELSAELQPNGCLRLTDMGDTLGYLYINGLTLSRGLLDSTKKICQRFGASLEGAELVVRADEHQEFGEAMHRLIQAVLSTTDLIQKRRPMERVDFDSEVESFVIVSGAVYDPYYKVQGRRSVHEVRFHVNSNRNLLIQPLSAPSEPVAFSWAERWAYRFNDILEQNKVWRCVAVLDDRGERSQVWSDRALKPLGDLSVLWAFKTRVSEMLKR